MEKRCEGLIADLGYRAPPIPLREIARAQGIRQVLFRPLLGDGATEVDGDGFRMYVKCKKEYVASWTQSYETDGGISLPKRTRFSIAHEIIHTFFFQKRHKPVSRLQTKHHKTIGSLERACNIGAGLLLLPTQMLWGELDEIDPFRPADLLKLGRKFAVSPHVLINRLAYLGGWSSERGVIALVTHLDGVPRIEAIVQTGVSGLFPDAKPNMPAKHLIYDPALVVYGGNQFQVVHNIVSRAESEKATQRCFVACKQIYKQPSTFLMTLKLQERQETASHSQRSGSP
ncbi:MAG: ImmA/IrrE family metallo-endopeptidase [Deltaproteobacteria bacterium]|nr:ImmA/IrrE family metallo-endopeptidase [Deltaproteobacteria bacterium]